MDGESIARNIEQLRRGIDRAAEACRRDPAEIELLAVSKTFPAEVVSQAVSTGQRLFGENRIQEAQSKIPSLRDRDLEWHLIGHLQSNKARLAVQLFDVVQSLDSLKLARRLDRLAGEAAKRLSVYLQVNLGHEDQKFGFSPEEASEAVVAVSSLPHLRLQGLMAIPPYASDPELTRPYFRRLAALRQAIGDDASIRLPGLSMGMSHDYQVAIEEGATLIRVGTAIFGPRTPA